MLCIGMELFFSSGKLVHENRDLHKGFTNSFKSFPKKN